MSRIKNVVSLISPSRPLRLPNKMCIRDRVEIQNRIKIKKQLCEKSSIKTLDEINALLNPINDSTPSESETTEMCIRDSAVAGELEAVVDRAIARRKDGVGRRELFREHIDRKPARVCERIVFFTQEFILLFNHFRHFLLPP